MKIKLLEQVLLLFQYREYLKVKPWLSSSFWTGIVALVLWAMGTPLPNSQLMWIWIAIRSMKELTVLSGHLEKLENISNGFNDVSVELGTQRGIPLTVQLVDKVRSS